MLLTFIVVIASLVVIVIVGVLALDRYLSGRPQNLDARPRAEAMQNGRELLLLSIWSGSTTAAGSFTSSKAHSHGLGRCSIRAAPGSRSCRIFAGQAERYGLDVHGAGLEWCAR